MTFLSPPSATSVFDCDSNTGNQQRELLARLRYVDIGYLGVVRGIQQGRLTSPGTIATTTTNTTREKNYYDVANVAAVVIVADTVNRESEVTPRPRSSSRFVPRLRSENEEATP